MVIPLRLTRRQWVILAIVVSIYGFGYLAARQNRWLVHRAAYETSDHGAKQYFHWVDRGDFGPALLFHSHSSAELWGQEVSYWMFTPLRWLEEAGFNKVEITLVAREEQPPHFQTLLAAGVK